jgi:hypothetical protein
MMLTSRSFASKPSAIQMPTAVRKSRSNIASALSHGFAAAAQILERP